MASSRCCGASGCSCKIIGGAAADTHTNIKVSGAGSTQSPLTITGAAVEAIGTDSVTLTVAYDAGSNTYTLEADFAATSSLDDLGDVVAPTPTNGQVLAYNAGTGKWIPAAATPAASGSVTHDLSLSGDGSVGTPLVVNHSASGGTATRADGVGLNDATLNSVVRHFASAAGRSAAVLAPVLNTLSVLDDAPGEVDYWDGSAWRALLLFAGDSGDALLEQSGPYVDQTPTFAFSAFVNDSTDVNGRVTLLAAVNAPLSTAAGIMSYSFNLESGYPFLVCYDTALGDLDAILYAVDPTDSSFTPAASVPVKGHVRAILY